MRNEPAEVMDTQTESISIQLTLVSNVTSPPSPAVSISLCLVSITLCLGSPPVHRCTLGPVHTGRVTAVSLRVSLCHLCHFPNLCGLCHLYHLSTRLTLRCHSNHSISIRRLRHLRRLCGPTPPHPPQAYVSFRRLRHLCILCGITSLSAVTAPCLRLPRPVAQLRVSVCGGRPGCQQTEADSPVH